MRKRDFIEQAMKRYSRVGDTKSRYWAEGLWQMLTDKSVDEIPDEGKYTHSIVLERSAESMPYFNPH